MRAFIDDMGRHWLLTLTYGEVRRVRALAGVDLPGLFDDQADPLANPSTLAHVLRVLCQSQADREGVPADVFEQGMGGNALSLGCDALLAELFDYFPEVKGTDRDSDQDEAQAPRGKIGERAEKLVWECAGVLGLDPSPFTLRQLLVMAQARGAEEWSRVSLLAAITFNANCADANDRKPPAHFNPYAKGETARPKPVAKVSVKALKGLFTKRGK